MTVLKRLGQKAMPSFGLMILIALSSQTFGASADNIWVSTFGQGWFHETRANSGQLLAGTWYEHSLEPGRTYRIEFTVNDIRGRMSLLVGDNPAVTINSRGDYSYDFRISENGNRRMLFRTQSDNVMSSVSGIAVNPRWSSTTTTSSSGSTGAAPRGHYISFARTRNLNYEVSRVLDSPNRSWSDFALQRARQLQRAFQTPGVKGFWMPFDWGDVEVRDGVYDWRLIDANMDVARRFGMKLLVKIGDRSFDGSNPLPGYFPSRYRLWSTGNGKSGYVAKRWDPYVYTRLIRLYRHIANRYANHAGFGGIASTETALGNIRAGDYTVAKYKSALVQIATQTQQAMSRGKFFMYVNFFRNGQHIDMRRDARVDVLNRIPKQNVIVGGPDVTPDRFGMPGSATSFRVHARRNMQNLGQFCHAQHVDQGMGRVNVKSNRARDDFRSRVNNLRRQESQSWYNGSPAIVQFDDLRDPQGRRVDRHPQWVLGQLWQPEELLAFGDRNFGCDYFIWHYREHPRWNEFGWEDIRPVIMNNQYFYM